MSTTPAPAAPQTCGCWTKTSALLAERGCKIHSACSAITISENGLNVRHYLPLQRADGGKPRAADAKGITITHCPFCGIAYPP